MTDDYVFIQSVIRAAVTDAYRLGIGAAIETLLRYRGANSRRRNLRPSD